MSPAAAHLPALAAAHGGAGAVAVFAVFVLACVVLAVLVVRFAIQQGRRRGRPPGEDDRRDQT